MSDAPSTGVLFRRSSWRFSLGWMVKPSGTVTNWSLRSARRSAATAVSGSISISTMPEIRTGSSPASAFSVSSCSRCCVSTSSLCCDSTRASIASRVITP